MTTKPGRPAIPANAFAHGDVRRYNRGCHCTPCTRAATANRRHARYLRETGRGTRTTPDRAATHIRRLRAAGLLDAQIQTAADNLAPDAFYAILRGARQIHRNTEARILAIPVPVTPATSRSCAPLPGIGTRRRLQALIANGWTAGALARHLGKTKQHIHYLMQPTASGIVRQHVANEIRNLYQKLATRRPEDDGVTPRYAAQARALAARNGWHGPLAWDDIDNPDAVPDTGDTPAPDRLRIDEVAEDAAWLAAAGYSSDQIAARLGISRTYVNKALTRWANTHTQEQAA